VIAPESSLPLVGKRVLVTRSKKQAGELTALLQARGAEVLELTAIEIVPAPSEPIDAALERLDSYDWVVFTSVNGVGAVLDRLNALGDVPQRLGVARVAAIGRATAQRLRDAGVDVAFVPEQFVAESVVEGLVAQAVSGKRILLPRADIARDTLPDGLRDAGAIVDVVVAYRTTRPATVQDDVLEAVRRGAIDIATFASPSTVRNTLDLIGGALPEHVIVACIGPITAAAASERGLRVDIEAAEYSIPGLVDAIVAGAGNVSGRERAHHGDDR
jgi:uroporphyrinogen-III synthase